MKLKAFPYSSTGGHIFAVFSVFSKYSITGRSTLCFKKSSLTKSSYQVRRVFDGAINNCSVCRVSLSV